MNKGKDQPIPRPRRGWLSTVARSLDSDFTHGVLSSGFAGYLKLVWATSRLTSEPTTPEGLFGELAPFIATAWHGEAFLLSLARPRAYPVDVMVSRAADGEVISRTLAKLGSGAVRGSGTTNPRRMFEKGAVSAFRGMKSSLDRGHSVVMTADFMSGTRHKASAGSVVLARLSGRPVVPLALVTSRRVEVSSWDRMVINLPFSRAALVIGDPITVPPHADEAFIEEKRLELERSLNSVTDRAYAIADRRRG